MKSVFLGGTCNNSKWRDKLIPELKGKYFNPVVENWTQECMDEEIKQREVCDTCLYVITSEMTGVYSIAEAVEDSIKRPNKTVFVFHPEGFNPHQIKSLEQVGSMIERNGAKWLIPQSLTAYLNIGA